MKNTLYTIVCIVIVLFVVAHQCDKSMQREYQEKANEPKQEIHCMVCGKDLTDDYNRISPNGNGNYYCTPCYKQTMREVHEDIRAEGYD
ncbi:hypothetical protein [Flavobacterium sp.]|uniref:hypothetical protein n=1 Tax=Flavobacterium sp. TaxID=239 RepID=UPI004034DBE6